MILIQIVLKLLQSFNDVRRVTYSLIKFHGTNQETCINQKPYVNEGQKVEAGDVLADGQATERR